MLAITCSAIHVADEAFRNNFQNYQSSLERGQILPMESLPNSSSVELVFEHIKYKMHVTKCGPSSYFVVMNDSYVEVEAH
ncbi:unnamed protein product, partial [Rotaria sp. Silwood1]